jgi:hypothetical protein
MVSLKIKTAFKYMAITAAITAAISTANPVKAQTSTAGQLKLTAMAEEKKSMYGYDEQGMENSLDKVLSYYYNVKLYYVETDPDLKQKLINEYLEAVKEKGYKLPKKIKSTDYFEPYKFILDLQVYFNKAGYIIPADQAGKGLASYAARNKD